MYTDSIENVLINNDQGIITEKDIEKSIENYSLSLKDPNDLYNPKNMLFNGLLRYIYNHNIKYIIPDTKENDYELLDKIFRIIYLPLCYRYSRVPSINNFCNHLLNKDIQYLYDVKSGTYRDVYKSKVNINHSIILQKWDEICNGDLSDYIVHTSSIGGIFRAKTKGFRENDTIKVELTNTPVLDLKQIQSAIDIDIPVLPNNNDV